MKKTRVYINDRLIVSSEPSENSMVLELTDDQPEPIDVPSLLKVMQLAIDVGLTILEKNALKLN